MAIKIRNPSKGPRKWRSILGYAFAWGFLFALLRGVLHARRAPGEALLTTLTANFIPGLVIGWVIGIPLGYLFWRQLSRQRG